MRIFDADITFAEWINFYFDYLYHIRMDADEKIDASHSAFDECRNFLIKKLLLALSCGRFRSIHCR